VEVPVPFARRRWVQVVAALLVGAGVVWFLIWLTNGIRQGREEDRAAAEQVERRRAVQAWQRLVEAEVAKVGTLGTVGVPPEIAPELGAALASLEDGGSPATARALEDAAERLDASADALAEHDLVDAIRDRFSRGDANALTNSQELLAASFRIYGSAARVALAGADAEGADRRALLDEASALRDRATEVLAEAWNEYSLGLDAAGLAPSGVDPTASAGGAFPDLGG
jgi:hypothetical protein